MREFSRDRIYLDESMFELGVQSFTAISKEDVARSLPALQRQIEDECLRWNREDGIIAALCLDDAYDNLLNAVLYDLTLVPASQQDADVARAAIIRHIVDRFILIRSATDFLANLGMRGHGKMSRIPNLEISFLMADDPNPSRDPTALREYLLSKGKLRPVDGYVGGGARLMGKFMVDWVVRVIDGRDTIEYEVIDRFVRLIQEFNKLLTYTSAVRIGATFQPPQGGSSFSLVNLPTSLTPETAMAAQDLGPRNLWGSSPIPAEWMSDFGNAVDEGIRLVHFDIGSPTSQQSMRREADELFQGFKNFPGFSELFLKIHGFGIADFRTVVDTLEKIALPHPHHLYKQLYGKIIRKATKVSGVGENVVRKIIADLTWQPGTYTRHFPMIKLESTYAFTLRKVRHEAYSRLAGTFLQYDNNSKGEAFENACRRLIGKSPDTMIWPGRLIVRQQVLSDDACLRIWGSKKVGTDFDILVAKGAYLIVLECKERKGSTHRKTRLTNMMYRYAEELVLKSHWLINNLGILDRTSEFKTKVLKDVSYLLPMLVCNIVVDEFGHSLQLLTPRELTHFFQAFDFSTSPDEGLIVEIPIAQEQKLAMKCLAVSTP